MKSLLGAVGAAVVLLAACSTSHPSAAPTPTPAAATSSPPSIDQLIAAAADRECTRFAAAYKVIKRDTAEDGIVAALMNTADVHGKHWNRLLRRAEQIPDIIPAGNNRARRLAVKIAEANLELGYVTLYSAFGGDSIPKIAPAWARAQRLLAAVQRACQGG